MFHGEQRQRVSPVCLPNELQMQEMRLAPFGKVILDSSLQLVISATQQGSGVNVSSAVMSGRPRGTQMQGGAWSCLSHRTQ